MRRLAGVLAGLSLCAIGAPEARAAGTCVYDGAGTVTATAEPGAAFAVFTVLAGGSMVFEGTPCGSATTANTTAVNIAASGRQVRVSLATAVTNTTITIANGGSYAYLHDDTPGAVHWKAGRLTDGRWVADLDGDGVAEFVSQTAGVVMYGWAGNDTLSGGGGIKGPGDETAGPTNAATAFFDGGAGEDILTGPGVVVPGPGNDTLVAGASGDTSLWYTSAAEAVHMKPDLSGTETGRDGYGQTDTYSGMATAARVAVFGSFSDDILYGGPGPDRLFGAGGADQAFGLGGNDMVIGNAGADTLEGGPGQDTIAGNDLNIPGTDVANVLRGGAGTDTMYGGAADDDFGAGDDEADVLKCFGGTDSGTADRVDTLTDCEFGPPTLSFAPASASVDEGAAAQFTLTLSYPVDVPASVDVLTLDDTATSGSDYTPIARRVTFAAGETTATVDVSATADDEDEAGETFTLALANPSNAPSPGPNASVTVNDTNTQLTKVVIGPEPGTGAGGVYLSPPTAVVNAPTTATEVRCVLDPAATPAAFADIPAGDCAYLGDGRTVDADGAHTLCAASTSTTTGDTTAVACATWATDATPPAVTCGTGSFKVGDKGKVVTASVADATSGAVTAALSAPADTATSGEKTVTFIGRDRAGNATTGRCAYSVSSVVLCGQPIVLLSVQSAGRRVRLSGLAAPAYAGKTVTVSTSGRRSGTAIVARDGSFSVAVKSSGRASARYQATLPDGGSTPAHKLSRSLAITKRSGTTVHGRILARKDLRPKRVSFYRQNTCTSQRVFATAKVSKSGTFEIKLAGPVAPEPIALYRVKARIGKNSRYTSYTLPIVVKGADR